MARRTVPRPLLAAIVVGHVVAVTLTWRDIIRRPRRQVRGPKWPWLLLTGVNTGAATVAYLALGRRRAGQRPAG